VTAVDRFFDKAAADSLLKLYFFNTDMAKHKQRFALYLAHLLDGVENTYPGRNVLAAHTGREIMDEATDRFIEELVRSLRESDVPSAQVEVIDKKLSAMKDLIGDSFVSPDKYVYKPQRMG
jgi:truncated hemoglobin YjbI